MSKVKIGATYRGDMSILQQQLDEVVKKTMEQLQEQQSGNPESDFHQQKSIIQRRLQQFFMNASSKFRSLVQYSRTQQREYQKVIMQPDQNLQKINELKVSMLRQSLIRTENEKWPQVKQKIQISQPQQLNIVHFQGYKQCLKDCISRNYQKVPDMSTELQKIQSLEQMIIQSTNKLQMQQKIDAQFINQK